MRPKPAGYPISGWTPGPLTRGGADGRVPDDGRYYITTFGGGSDTQSVACSGFPIADGSYYYIADKDRFGCGTRVRVTDPASGRSVIAVVVDIGPAQWVERNAGGPIIDASPIVLDYLFGSHNFGWEDHKLVTAEPVPSDTPLGPEGAPSLSLASFVVTAVALGGVYWWATRPKRPAQRVRRNGVVDYFVRGNPRRR